MLIFYLDSLGISEYYISKMPGFVMPSEAIWALTNVFLQICELECLVCHKKRVGRTVQEVMQEALDFVEKT